MTNTRKIIETPIESARQVPGNFSPDKSQGSNRELSLDDVLSRHVGEKLILVEQQVRGQSSYGIRCDCGCGYHVFGSSAVSGAVAIWNEFVVSSMFYDEIRVCDVDEGWRIRLVFDGSEEDEPEADVSSLKDALKTFCGTRKSS